jgi:hypothetical protein
MKKAKAKKSQLKTPMSTTREKVVISNDKLRRKKSMERITISKKMKKYYRTCLITPQIKIQIIKNLLHSVWTLVQKRDRLLTTTICHRQNYKKGIHLTNHCTMLIHLVFQVLCRTLQMLMGWEVWARWGI